MTPYGLNLKSFNDLKKDQTNIKIFKYSSFDSNFNSVQNLNTNLSQLLHQPSISKGDLLSAKARGFASATQNPKDPAFLFLDANASPVGEKKKKKNIINPKFSAIIRAIRSIRLNRDEWKLIRYINLMEKKIISNPFSGCFYPAPISSSSDPALEVEQSHVSFIPPASATQNPKDSFSCPPCFQRGGIKKINKKKKLLLSQDARFLFSYLQKGNSKIFSYNNIISKNILLRNTSSCGATTRYNFLKSTLSSILKKKIRKISEILEDKPIKNYVPFSYLNNCIFSPPHLNSFGSEGPSQLWAKATASKLGVLLPPARGRTKLSLNKYKGNKFGSFINYNKIIGYKFNSTFYQIPPCDFLLKKKARVAGTIPNLKDSIWKNLKNNYLVAALFVARGVKNSIRPFEGANYQREIYIKDTYKLLFYLFKSMYCLISKPVFKYTNDKVIIQLFYYLNIPKKKIFRLFSISYINSIKKKWLALMERKNKSIYPAPSIGKKKNPLFAKIYIRWKLRKAISRFKNKNSKTLLFKLRKFNLTKVFQNKFKLILKILSLKFNKPVELQLIRLHHPYHDSNILVNLLSLNIKNKRKKARVAVQKIYNKKPVKNLNFPNLKSGKLVPAFLSGLNIKIAGRLMGEPIIPRITNKIYGKGATAIGKVNYLDIARITKKNRKGAYTIKITSGQNFF